MATTVSIAGTSGVIACDAIVDACDNGTTNPQGTLIIYDDGASGASVPANVDAALPGGVIVLAQLPMRTPGGGGAFNAAAVVSSVARAIAGAITDDLIADNTGDAYFCRVVDRDNTPKLQGSVAVSGSFLNLPTISIAAGIEVAVSSMQVDVPL